MISMQAFLMLRSKKLQSSSTKETFLFSSLKQMSHKSVQKKAKLKNLV